MFEHLQNFMVHMLEADAHFTMFPHNLSNYNLLEDLPEMLEDPDHIPGEVSKWLEYFPEPVAAIHIPRPFSVSVSHFPQS